MINLGILLFGLSVVFTIITLPVEFNASRRAVACLGDSGILYDDEIGGVKKSSFGGGNDIRCVNGCCTCQLPQTYNYIRRKKERLET